MKHEEAIPKSEISVEILNSIVVKYSISLSGEYDEITPDNLQKILKDLREGQLENIYFSNDPNLEEGIMELQSANGLFTLRYSIGNIDIDGEMDIASYSTYDPEYLNSDVQTEIEDIGCIDGKFVLRKYTTMDKNAVMAAIEYYIRTGKLWNGISWLKSWQEIEEDNAAKELIVKIDGTIEKINASTVFYSKNPALFRYNVNIYYLEDEQERWIQIFCQDEYTEEPAKTLSMNICKNKITDYIAELSLIHI